MNKLSKIYINIGYYCCSWPCDKGSCFRLPCFQVRAYPVSPCMGGSLWEWATNWLTWPWGEASLVVILYWFWLFVFIVEISLVFSLAQHNGRTSQALWHTLVSPHLTSWVRGIQSLRPAWVLQQDLTQNQLFSSSACRIHIFSLCLIF